jgi:hypothetical protein
MVLVSTSMRMRSSTVSEHAHAAQQLDHRGDVVQVRHVADDIGPSASSVAARIGSAAFLAPEIRTSPSSGLSARDLQLVHECRALSWPRAASSSGVSVSNCRAWISPPIRSPSDAVDHLVTLRCGRLPGELARHHGGLVMHVWSSDSHAHLRAGQRRADQLFDLVRIHWVPWR